MVKLVSNNTPEELAQVKKRQRVDRAREQVRSALVQMTANLLRVTRGAGRPAAIVSLASDFLQACVEYRDAAALNPDPEMLTDALEWHHDPELLSRLDEFNQRHLDADEKMVRGALQIAASRLLGQSTQEAAGHNELYEGMREWEDMRDRRNREMFKAATKPKRPKPRPSAD